MLKNDTYLFTNPSPTNGRKGRKAQDSPLKNSSEHLTDVAKAFNGLANKFRGRKPHALITTNIKDVRQHLEPKTPDEQVFRFSDGTPSSTLLNFNPPELTPDSLFSGVSPKKSSAASPVAPSVRSQKLVSRKPVPQLESVPPLFLGGLSKTLNRKGSQSFDSLSGAKYGKSIQQKEERCVFCDMALDTRFVSETISHLPCGHSAHRDCVQGLLKVCEQYGDEPPSCTICDVSITSNMLHSSSTMLLNQRTEETRSIKSIHSLDPVGTEISNDNDSVSSSGNDITEKYMADNHSNKNNFAHGGLYFKESKALRPGSAESASTLYKEAQGSNTSLAPRCIENTGEYEIPVYIEDCNSIDGADFSYENLPSSQLSFCTFPKSTFTISTPSMSSSMEPASPPSSPLSSKPQSLYHQAVSDIFLSDPLCHNVPNGKNKSPLRMTTDVKHLDDKTQVAVCLQAVDSHGFDRTFIPYHSSAKDIQAAIDIKKSLDHLDFKGRKISSLQLGLPRLASKVYVSSPLKYQLVWEDCDAYLFESTLILITELKRVRAVLKYTQAIRSATLHPEDSTTVRLAFTTKELPPLDLQMHSRASAFSWVQALSNTKSQYPLCLDNWISYAFSLEAELDSNGEQWPFSQGYASTDIILCIPHNLVTTSPDCQKRILEIFGRIENNTEVAVILYSKTKQIINSTYFHSPCWNGWKSILSGKKDAENTPSCDHISRSPKGTSNEIDSILESAESIFKDRTAPNPCASMVIVSEDTATYESIPSSFESQGIPIHTVTFMNNTDMYALASLANATSGMFSYVKTSSEFLQVLGNLLVLESKYVVQDAVITLRSRIGAKIDCVQKTYIDSPKNTILHDEKTRSVEWKIGKMRTGDIKCITFDVKGEIPPNHPLLQISIDANYMRMGKYGQNTSSFGNNESKQSCQENVNTVRLIAPSYNIKDNSRPNAPLLESELLIGTVFNTLEASISGLMLENTRKSFNPLVSGLEKARQLQANIDNTSSPLLSRALETIIRYLDSNCDGVIERVRGFDYYLADFLQKIWLLGTRRALLVRDNIEEIFFIKNS